MNRRQFAYVTTLAGAMRSPVQSASAATPRNIPEAAGLITEMVFLDDCVRVAMYDPALSNAAKTALAENGDLIRNGALSPAVSGAKTAAEFALAAGRESSEILHRYRRPYSAEARLYQDAAILRDISAAAGCNPDKPAPVGDLLDVLHVRRRLRLHTLIPDDSDYQTLQTWLDGVCVWWQDQRNLRAALAAVYTSPDNSKMQEFVSGFYSAADPLIQLARGYQYGRLAPPDGFGPALDKARQGGGYSRALVGAVEALRKAPQPPQ